MNKKAGKELEWKKNADVIYKHLLNTLRDFKN